MGKSFGQALDEMARKSPYVKKQSAEDNYDFLHGFFEVLSSMRVCSMNLYNRIEGLSVFELVEGVLKEFAKQGDLSGEVWN